MISLQILFETFCIPFVEGTGILADKSNFLSQHFPWTLESAALVALYLYWLLCIQDFDYKLLHRDRTFLIYKYICYIWPIPSNQGPIVPLIVGPIAKNPNTLGIFAHVPRRWCSALLHSGAHL
jgi:hypothetical protein